MSNLANKTVLVTGASKGIGAAIARHCASIGARVVLSARNKFALDGIVQEIRDAGGQAVAAAGDVSNYKDVERAVVVAMSEFGGLHALVNNAGLIDPIARLADSNPESWGHVVDVNVKGVYHGIRAAIPKMQQSGGGTIINMSSGAAKGALEGWSHYCCTKAAVLSLTACTDKEYRDKGIRSLGLSPGTVATDMQRSIKDSGINPVSKMDWEAHIPPERVAHAIDYLCGVESDEFLGRDFSLMNDGGRAKLW